MGAKPSFYMKFIATYATAFFGYKNPVLARVDNSYLLFTLTKIIQFFLLWEINNDCYYQLFLELQSTNYVIKVVYFTQQSPYVEIPAYLQGRWKVLVLFVEQVKEI